METAVQRRRRRARAHVTRVALRLFTEQGYAATSAEQVAAAADLSRSTLFRYFTDKDDLLFGLEDDLLVTATAALESAAHAQPPWSALHTASLALAGEIDAEHQMLVERERIIATSPALQARAAAKHRRWEAALTQALADNYPLQAPDAGLLAKLAVACFEVAEQQWLAGGGHLGALIDQAFSRLPALLP